MIECHLYLIGMCGEASLDSKRDAVGNEGGGGSKFKELLNLYHQIISDLNQSPSDISSDGVLKIILSP